jgi:hypothetical protein
MIATSMLPSVVGCNAGMSSHCCAPLMLLWIRRHWWLCIYNTNFQRYRWSYFVGAGLYHSTVRTATISRSHQFTDDYVEQDWRASSLEPILKPKYSWRLQSWRKEEGMSMSAHSKWYQRVEDAVADVGLFVCTECITCLSKSCYSVRYPCAVILIGPFGGILMTFHDLVGLNVS